MHCTEENCALAQRFIWAVIDWEILVNSYGKHQCWYGDFEPNSAIGIHASVLCALQEGFRAGKGHQGFWNPHGEFSWVQKGFEGAKKAYAPKLMTAITHRDGLLPYSSEKEPILITDNYINLNTVVDAHITPSMIQHYILDSLRFAVDILRPFLNQGINLEGGYGPIDDALYLEKKQIQENLQDELRTHLHPFCMLLCGQMEDYLPNYMTKYPHTTQNIRNEYENERLEDF